MRKLPRLNLTAARWPGIAASFENLVGSPHGLHSDAGVDVGAVVDDPLRGNGHDGSHVAPPLVAGRDHGEQRLEQGQGLPMVLSGFGPAKGFAERLYRLVVAGVGCLHHVAGRGTVAAGFDQHPGRVAVKRSAACPADLAVDGLLDQRVADLVEELAAFFELGDEPDLAPACPGSRPDRRGSGHSDAAGP